MIILHKKAFYDRRRKAKKKKDEKSMYSVNVHVLSTAQLIFYVYDESIATQGANKVATFLFHFIANLFDPEAKDLQTLQHSASFTTWRCHFPYVATLTWSVRKMSICRTWRHQNLKNWRSLLNPNLLYSLWFPKNGARLEDNVEPKIC